MAASDKLRFKTVYFVKDIGCNREFLRDRGAVNSLDASEEKGFLAFEQWFFNGNSIAKLKVQKELFTILLLHMLPR